MANDRGARRRRGGGKRKGGAVNEEEERLQRKRERVEAAALERQLYGLETTATARHKHAVPLGSPAGLNHCDSKCSEYRWRFEYSRLFRWPNWPSQ